MDKSYYINGGLYRLLYGKRCLLFTIVNGQLSMAGAGPQVMLGRGPAPVLTSEGQGRSSEFSSLV